MAVTWCCETYKLLHPPTEVTNHMEVSSQVIVFFRNLLNYRASCIVYHTLNTCRLNNFSGFNMSSVLVQQISMENPKLQNGIFELVQNLLKQIWRYSTQRPTFIYKHDLGYLPFIPNYRLHVSIEVTKWGWIFELNNKKFSYLAISPQHIRWRVAMERMPHILPKQFIKILNIYSVMRVYRDCFNSPRLYRETGLPRGGFCSPQDQQLQEGCLQRPWLTQCYNEQYCVFQWLSLFSETVQLYWAVRSTEKRWEGTTKHPKKNVCRMQGFNCAKWGHVSQPSLQFKSFAQPCKYSPCHY